MSAACAVLPLDTDWLSALLGRMVVLDRRSARPARALPSLVSPV
jgi:hypothetical protein